MRGVMRRVDAPVRELEQVPVGVRGHDVLGLRMRGTETRPLGTRRSRAHSAERNLCACERAWPPAQPPMATYPAT